MPSRSRRSRRNVHSQVVVIAIVALLLIPFAYYVSPLIFATLWQTQLGPSTITLAYNEPLIGLEELKRLGSKTVNLELIAEATQLPPDSNPLQMSILMPSLVFENPYGVPMAVASPTMPEWELVQYAYTGTAPTQTQPPPTFATRTRTILRTTVTGSSGTIVAGTTSRLATQTTTTPQTAPTEMITTGWTDVRGEVFRTGGGELNALVLAGGEWEDAKVYGGGGTTATTRPVDVRRGEVVEFRVTVQHVEGLGANARIFPCISDNPQQIGACYAELGSSSFVGDRQSKTFIITVGHDPRYGALYSRDTMYVRVRVDIESGGPRTFTRMALSYSYSKKAAPTSGPIHQVTTATGANIPVRNLYYHRLVGSIGYAGKEHTDYSSPVVPLSTRLTLRVPLTVKWVDYMFPAWYHLNVRYEIYEITVSGSGPPTNREVDIYGDRFTVPVPSDGAVIGTNLRGGWRVGVDLHAGSFVAFPRSPIYVRNVVTNLNSRTISFEIVNQYPEQVTARVTVNTFDPRDVVIPALSSQRVVLDVSHMISEGMINYAKTNPGAKLSLNVGVEWLSPKLPVGVSKPRLSFEAVFNVPRDPAQFTVQSSGPGRVEVLVNGKPVGGAGTHSAYVGDEITVKTIPQDQNSFLCSFIAMSGSGEYLRYEPCDILVLGGNRKLPDTWSFKLPHGGFTASAEFKSIFDPDVAEHRTVQSGALYLHHKVRITSKGEVLAFNRHVDEYGNEYLDATLKNSWTLYNDWDFPVTVDLTAGTGPAGVEVVNVRYGATMSPTRLVLQPRSSQTVVWEVQVTGAKIEKPRQPVVIRFGGRAGLSAATQYETVSGGLLYRLVPTGASPLPTIHYLFQGSASVLDESPQASQQPTQPPTTPAPTQPSGFSSDGAGRPVYVQGGTSVDGKVTDGPLQESGVTSSYNEVPLRATSRSPSGQETTLDVTVLEAPPAADLSQVSPGAPVVQPQIPQRGGGPTDPIARFFDWLWSSIAGFFSWLWRGLTGGH